MLGGATLVTQELWFQRNDMMVLLRRGLEMQVYHTLLRVAEV